MATSFSLISNISIRSTLGMFDYSKRIRYSEEIKILKNILSAEHKRELFGKTSLKSIVLRIEFLKRKEIVLENTKRMF